LAKNGALNIKNLENIAKQVRRDIIEMTFGANSGHPGGSLSAVEILTSLYCNVMQHKPNDPTWEDRDRFIMSKAHASPVLYAILAHCGYIKRSDLATYRKIDSKLQGHAHIMTPGIDMSGGSLGQGLSFGLGITLASKIDMRTNHVYVLLGDGECDEGQVWEAAMASSHYKVSNLTAIVDRNHIQNDRFTHEVMNLEPLDDKWKAFGWNVISIDGHNITDVNTALNEAKSFDAGPTVIIAQTVKGKGVSFMENNPQFHGKAPNKEQYVQAMKELS